MPKPTEVVETLDAGLAGSATADAMVRSFIERYTVLTGPGGVTVFIDSSGRMLLGDDPSITHRVEDAFPDRLECAAFWRQLRSAEGVRELIDVTVQRPATGSYVEARYQADEPGWYHVAGGKGRLVSPYSGFTLVDMQFDLAEGTDMAIGTHQGQVSAFHGYLGDPDVVFTPVKNHPSTTLLVLCPFGVTAQFAAVVETRSHELRVVLMRVGRQGPEKKFFKPPQPVTPPYIAVRDKKGKVRVFMRPVR